MKKIDIHLHLALEKRMMDNSTEIAGCDEMIQHLHSLGIGHGIVLSMGEGNGGNDEAKAISEKHPDTYYWMCNVDFAEEESIYERLKKYKNQGAIGIGELMINKYINHPFIQRVFEAAEKLNMPVLFHMSPEENYNYGIVDEAGLPFLEEALKKFPNLKIIGHSQPFWHEITGDADPSTEMRNSWGQGNIVEGGRVPYLLKKYPNLYADLSANSGGQAVMRDEDFGISFLEQYQDQLMFGTDMVNTEMEFPLGKWLDQKLQEEKLSKEAYDKICWKNAKKVFDI